MLKYLYFIDFKNFNTLKSNLFNFFKKCEENRKSNFLRELPKRLNFNKQHLVLYQNKIYSKLYQTKLRTLQKAIFFSKFIIPKKKFFRNANSISTKRWSQNWCQKSTTLSCCKLPKASESMSMNVLKSCQQSGPETQTC